MESEEKKTKEQELKELFKALGYVAGEVVDIAEDGLGFDDLMSVKDIIDNGDMLMEGFKVEGDFKEILKGFSYETLMSIILEAKAGYDLGLK